MPVLPLLPEIKGEKGGEEQQYLVFPRKGKGIKRCYRHLTFFREERKGGVGWKPTFGGGGKRRRCLPPDKRVLKLTEGKDKEYLLNH